MSRGICPSLETLSDYARKVLSKEKSEAIRRHIEICEECRFVASFPAKAPPRALMPLAGHLVALASKPRPERLAFGQLWSVTAPPSEPALAVLTYGQQDSLDSSDPDLRACFIRGDFAPDEPAIPGTLLCGADDSEVQVPFAIDLWNERPILVRQLDRFLGNLSRSFSTKLQRSLKALDARASSPLSPEAETFRRMILARTEPFSAPFREHLEGALDSAPLSRAPANELSGEVAYAADSDKDAEIRLVKLYSFLRRMRAKKMLPQGLSLERTPQGFLLKMAERATPFSLHLLAGKRKVASFKSSEGVLPMTADRLQKRVAFDDVVVEPSTGHASKKASSRGTPPS